MHRTTSTGGPDDPIDVNRPSPARMYDYFLGGSHNFPADRQVADEALTIYPDVAHVARANRAFLRRVVRYLVDQGIDQFLDIGSGIPTAGNVHEIAGARNSDARVVYVDIDPIAVHHSLEILADIPTATAVRADARDPNYILTHPDVVRLLDLSRPVGVLLLASLQFVLDDAEIRTLVGTLGDAVAAGSHIAISHVTAEGASTDAIAQTEKLYTKTTNPGTTRSRARLLPLFEGLDLVPPGLVYAPLWHPESREDLFLDDPPRSANFVGVGRKPEGAGG